MILRNRFDQGVEEGTAQRISYAPKEFKRVHFLRSTRVGLIVRSSFMLSFRQAQLIIDYSLLSCPACVLLCSGVLGILSKVLTNPWYDLAGRVCMLQSLGLLISYG